MRELPDSQGPTQVLGRGREGGQSHPCTEIWPRSPKTWVQFLAPKLCDFGQLVTQSEPQFPS